MGRFKDKAIDDRNQLVESFEGTFAEIYSEALQILIDRQRKYGPENIREQGIFGIMTRIGNDKLERVRQCLNGSVKNGRIALEPIDSGTEENDTFEDALIDIANYALIAVALHRGVWGRPLMDKFNNFHDEDDFELPDILKDLDI
jgi:hypothetical protein